MVKRPEGRVLTENPSQGGTGSLLSAWKNSKTTPDVFIGRRLLWLESDFPSLACQTEPIFSPFLVSFRALNCALQSADQGLHVLTKWCIYRAPEGILCSSFMSATIDNARNSLQEPGIARFDVVQQRDDPTRFVLVEAYRDDSAAAAHKETAHYKKWRDVVADMMAEPRASVKYTNVFPSSTEW